MGKLRKTRVKGGRRWRPLLPLAELRRRKAIRSAIRKVGAMHTSDRGIAIIKGFEDLRLVAYQDDGGVWTIGYGHTGPDVTPGKTITESVAVATLREDAVWAEHAVKRHVKVPLTQSMFDALVSFTLNVGEDALETSRLLVELNRTAYLNVPEQMTRWKWDNKKPYRGLLIRRLTEGLLFLQDGIPENAQRADTPLPEDTK